MMQGQGRGFQRPGLGGGQSMGFGYGMNYGIPGQDYGWGFGYPQPPPPPPLVRPPMYGRGLPRPPPPLGVQGPGILKRPAGQPQGPLLHGRGHARGYGGRAWGGRGRKNLTKEALDADLDEWRQRDKKFAGHSLDADLDEYWRKKDEIPEDSRTENEVRSLEAHTQSSPRKDVQKGLVAQSKEATIPKFNEQLTDE